MTQSKLKVEIQRIEVTHPDPDRVVSELVHKAKLILEKSNGTK